MAQLSRPFQVVLVVFVLFAGVWLFALQGRSTSTGGSGSSAPVSTSAPSSSASAPTAAGHAGSSSSAAASSAAAQAKEVAAPTHVYHGAAPGVQGLSRAIAKAHEAVASSQQSAQQVEGESAEGGSAPAASAKVATPTAKAVAPQATGTSTHAPASTVHKTSAAPRKAAGTTTPSGQRAVEADLAKGDVVVLLFWNPKGTDDVAVRRAVQQVQKTGRSPGQRVAVQEASAGQVASFGSVTRGVQVYTTPTIFIINQHKQAIVLTGVQDAFSIGQAIAEARQS
ncbi:MAG: hypothetical protein ACLQBY_17750 [Solirubrobacteraceae bacterium]